MMDGKCDSRARGDGSANESARRMTMGYLVEERMKAGDVGRHRIGVDVVD